MTRCVPFELGERVSGEGHIADLTCLLCRTGQAHICERVEIIGVDRDGAFAEYVAIPEYNVWKLDPEIADVAAAIFDPLGNAVHTVMAAGVSVKNVVITGVGSIGLMAIPVARAAGATAIFAIDVNAAKLELARRLGADAAFLSTQPDLVDEIKRRTRGDGADVLLEMSGSGAAIDLGLQTLRNGGTAALLGIPADNVNLNLAERIIFKGLTVWASMADACSRPGIRPRRSSRAAASTRARSSRTCCPTREFDRAFELMEKGEAVKIVFDFKGDIAKS